MNNTLQPTVEDAILFIVTMNLDSKQQRQCSVNNCNSPHYGLGFCSKHYYRNKRNGSPHILRGRGADPVHGMNGTRIHRIWTHMKTRCYNPNCNQYHNYGGRGIKVCEAWHNFEYFLEDMGDTYENGMSIERIDVNGDYEPDNCKWIPVNHQQKNKRTTTQYEYNGESHNIPEWADIVGLKENTLRARLKDYGWSIERALTTPNRCHA